MTTRTTQRAALAAMAAMALLAATASHAGEAMARITSQKVLRVAVPVDYPPYGSVGIDMSPRGLDVDVAKLLAEKLGVKVELVPVTAPNRVAYIQTRKVDLTISSLGKTPEREKVIDYSMAYAPFYDAVYGTKGLAVKGFADMAGKTVSVTRGSMQDKELQEMAPKANVLRFEDNNSTVAAFRAGQTQMMAIGTTVVEALKQRDTALDADLKVILSNSPCYIGMAKDEPELKAKVNEIIRKAKSDGTLNSIAQRWLNAPLGELPE